MVKAGANLKGKESQALDAKVDWGGEGGTLLTGNTGGGIIQNCQRREKRGKTMKTEGAAGPYQARGAKEKGPSQKKRSREGKGKRPLNKTMNQGKKKKKDSLLIRMDGYSDIKNRRESKLTAGGECGRNGSGGNKKGGGKSLNQRGKVGGRLKKEKKKLPRKQSEKEESQRAGGGGRIGSLEGDEKTGGVSRQITKKKERCYSLPKRSGRGKRAQKQKKGLRERIPAKAYS